MANNLIPEELNALIQQYLTDGVLTDKERQVILNKAEKMGLDRDEIDLYLDAEVQKIDQQTDAAVRKQKGKTCPYCGGSIPQLADKCPHCGENITPQANEELQEIFDTLEDALVDLKAGKDIHVSKATVERYARKAKIYFGNNPKIQKLLDEIEIETNGADKQARTIARNQTIVNLLIKFKSIILVLVLVIVGLWYFLRPDPANNPEACVNAVVSAVKSGNLEKAAGICATFKNNHPLDADDIIAAYTAVTKAYVEKGDYDQAIQLVEGVHGLHKLLFSLRKDIADKCIEAGKYDDAEKYGYFSYDDYGRYFDYICKCIDHMKANGQQNEVKSFIDRKMSIPDPRSRKWDSKTFPKKLYEYAGLK